MAVQQFYVAMPRYGCGGICQLKTKCMDEIVNQMIAKMALLALPHLLPEPLVQRIRQQVTVLDYPRGSYLLKEGQVCRGTFFLVKGLTRSYFNKDNREITTRLQEEGSFVACWNSFHRQEPGEENIRAIEKCTTVYLDHETIEDMQEDYPLFANVSRNHLYYLYCEAEMRNHLMSLPTAFDKYSLFYKEHYSIIQRFSQKHIASYLGMNEETLSRVRSQFLKTITPPKRKRK